MWLINSGVNVLGSKRNFVVEDWDQNDLDFPKCTIGDPDAIKSLNPNAELN